MFDNFGLQLGMFLAGTGIFCFGSSFLLEKYMQFLSQQNTIRLIDEYLVTLLNYLTTKK